MTITIKTTHKQEAKDFLLHQFKNKANIEGYLDSLIDQIQDSEGMFEALLNNRTITAATGEQLDFLGRIVGEDREGKDDATYRIFINARIQLNKSSGTTEELFNLIRIITSNDSSMDISINENFPAKFVLYINEVISDPQTVFEIVSSAKAAGVGFEMIYTLKEPVFRFSGTAGEAFSTTEVSDDGGYWASILT